MTDPERLALLRAGYRLGYRDGERDGRIQSLLDLLKRLHGMEDHAEAAALLAEVEALLRRAGES